MPALQADPQSRQKSLLARRVAIFPLKMNVPSRSSF